MNEYKDIAIEDKSLCEPVARYSSSCFVRSLFPDISMAGKGDIRVVELFAGVGGFRIGLERASGRFHTVWNNQWEPSTKRQDASIIYCRNFGSEGHSNQDIATVHVDEIPAADLLVGGFPCQDYSVAATLKHSGGIEGKKGVLWWEIYRILRDHKEPPRYLLLENVDRLLNSPASQRGRDFAIILASLSDLGYDVEWRVINAAEYGMPQRRRRTYIFAFKKDSRFAEDVKSARRWLLDDGIFARAFPVGEEVAKVAEFDIEGSIPEVSSNFNRRKALSPFRNSGFMSERHVVTLETRPTYYDMRLSLGDILLPEEAVDEEYFIDSADVDRWRYAKGGKSEKRVNKATGFEYNYSEGAMAFPDSIDKPSRTIITGEGGASPSRFKHVVLTPSGRFRRLTPLELERLNMFPDNHTLGASPARRAFLMGNALVTGIVERIGKVLLTQI